MASADIDQWTPNDPIWAALIPHLAHENRGALKTSNLGLELTMASAYGGGEIINQGCESAQGILFTAASAHTDPDFDRHFLLFVLDGPGTTRLESWNHLEDKKVFKDIYQVDAEPQTPPHASVTMKPGTLILFDGHRLHRAVVGDAEKTLVNGLRKILPNSRPRFTHSGSLAALAQEAGLIDHPSEVNRLVTLFMSMMFRQKPTRETL